MKLKVFLFTTFTYIQVAETEVIKCTAKRVGKKLIFDIVHTRLWNVIWCSKVSFSFYSISSFLCKNENENERQNRPSFHHLNVSRESKLTVPMKIAKLHSNGLSDCDCNLAPSFIYCWIYPHKEITETDNSNDINLIHNLKG